ncbi:MAG: alkaline shock response membrane anchor protein AmaP [Clostridia bacterium]|nr:alkaline shock response membrane anchor protein AmaP [Clostridia bacterium]
MYKSVWTRVLAALGGVTLWVLGLCALAETFFQAPVTAKIGQLLGAGTPLAVLAVLLLAIALCAFGTCCLMMLSHKRAVKRTGFVMQQSENGVIGVSVKSIEGLVQTCVRQHEVIASAEVSVVERKDGIIILLNIREAAGVNIPLSIGALQKQIKQYVTDCTGVDVHEVRVLVDNTEDEASASPYAVKSPAVPGAVFATAAEPSPVPELRMPEEFFPEENVEEPAAEEAAPAPAPVMPVVPMGPAVPPMPAIPEEEDDRPLHQRLFGTEEQPVIVPAPPEMLEPVLEEVIEEPAEEAVEEPMEEIPEDIPAEAYDGHAVLEVVEAIVQEEQLLEAEETAEIAENEAAAEEIPEESEDDIAEDSVEEAAEEPADEEAIPEENEEKIPE